MHSLANLLGTLSCSVQSSNSDINFILEFYVMVLLYVSNLYGGLESWSCISSSCLSLFNKSHLSCELAAEYTLTVWMIAKHRREILGPRRQNLFFLFCFCHWSLDLNQFGGVSKHWDRWNRLSIFELEIRHEQRPHLDCSKSRHSVFHETSLTTIHIPRYRRARKLGWAW